MESVTGYLAGIAVAAAVGLMTSIPRGQLRVDDPRAWAMALLFVASALLYLASVAAAAARESGSRLHRSQAAFMGRTRLRLGAGLLSLAIAGGLLALDALGWI